MRNLFLSLLSILWIHTQMQAQDFYDLKAKTIEGEAFDFSTLKGHKVLIVNTASKCGFTSQYEGLQKLHELYKDKGLIIIGFPSNDFLKQEPGANEEIAQFCRKNYGVDFLMMEKIHVKGKKKHPVYQWLTKKSLNKVKNSRIKWNFQKYLIDQDGNWQQYFSPTTKPLSQQIKTALEL